MDILKTLFYFFTFSFSLQYIIISLMKSHIFRRSVYPLTPHIKEMIRSVANLGKVVQDPAHNYYNVLMESIHYIILSLLFFYLIENIYESSNRRISCS